MENFKLNNSKIKWVKWFGSYSVVKKSDEDGEKLIEVCEGRVYFNDGSISEDYGNDDTALTVASIFVNTLI